MTPQPSAPRSPRELVAACMDHVALEGRLGLSVYALFTAVDPSDDTCVRRQVWRLLRSTSSVLHFFRASSSPSKKRKRPTSSNSDGDSLEIKKEALGAAETTVNGLITTEELRQMTYEQAVAGDSQQVMVVACEDLRHRALNIPVKAVAADLMEEHLLMLEAVGKARVRGITVTALSQMIGDTVKRAHNWLDTLLSYELVVKRMMIVGKPNMRRLNIIHLPRFAAAFKPSMLSDSAEFESDEQSKKLLGAATEAYLKKLPTHTSVLSDMGRDLGLHRRQLEALKSYIVQESKAGDNFRLELFQAVLQPSRRASLEPKILNCVRYKPPDANVPSPAYRRGLVLELGLLEQIYGIIEASAENGTTILDLRNQITLPGSKMPYKLVGLLAGAYGLQAETIIQGKNKAYRLYLDSVTPAPTAMDCSALPTATEYNAVPCSPSPSAESIEIIPASSEGKARGVSVKRSLKRALGSAELDGTNARRSKHIMERLEQEKIISVSSLRASVFRMEKLDAEKSTPTKASSTRSNSSQSVGLVDTRSIFRLATELELAKKLRLLQLPLPAQNVSTKFRALRCVVYPGYEEDDRFIQAYVKNYCRDERLRRLHQNAETGEVARFQKYDRDDMPKPKAKRVGRKRRRPNSEAHNVEPTELCSKSPSSTEAGETGRESNDPGSHPPHEVSYRIRRFESQQKSGIHNLQYKKLGFAYGVMYRCKVLHHFLWTYLHKSDGSGVTIQYLEEEKGDGGTGTAIDTVPEQAAGPKGIVFSREAVLHAMPVHLYIQVFSGGEILTDADFAVVQAAIANKWTFDQLPDDVREKIWSHETQRTMKVLGTMADLGLLAPHKIGMKHLVKILRVGYTDGRDGVLSQALKDNALGGLFLLNKQVRIELNDHSDGDQADGTDRRSVNLLSSLRIVGFTEKNYSFGSTLPLQFSLESESDVDRYWEALECLCLDQMTMEVENPRRNEPSVCEVPKPVKTRARRMLRILAWIPKSRKQAPKRKVADDMKCGGIVSTHIRTRKKRRVQENGAVLKGKKKRSKSRADSSDEVGADALMWADEEEQLLVDYFIDNCRSRWKIGIPQALQRDTEHVAFRNHTLSRSGFGLVAIARKLGKRKIDVKKRLKEKCMEPTVKLLFENAKRAAQLADNPGGMFDEEAAIRGSPRLTALFRRAILMIASPREEYHPLVAEELISFWSTHEIRLVWRYLWLKNWIVRASEKERGRGYATSKRLQDALKVNTLSYPLLLFQQAAEQESMVSSTLEEITPDGHTMDGPQNSDNLFEDDFPTNATPGQCALELGCQVLGTCSLTAFHSRVCDDIDADTTTQSTEAEEHESYKRQPTAFSVRLLGKNLKDRSGFAAHLANKVNVTKPAELVDCWRVETKMHGVALEDPELAQELEAFSDERTDDSCGFGPSALIPPRNSAHIDAMLEQSIVSRIRESGEVGLTLLSLMELLRATPNDDLRLVSQVRVARCLNALVEEGTLLCVNAYYDQRYILKEHGDVWLLRPFSLTPRSGTSSVPRVVFEDNKDTLSFPWLKMDGGTNCKFLFKIQRKLLSLVIQSPGITEERAYVKMDKLLSVQDTREALSLLVEEGLVYTRAVSTDTAAPVSIFGSAQSSAARVVKIVGNVLAYDRSAFVVHYFPHVECIQRFGSTVKDYQNEVSEFQRD